MPKPIFSRTYFRAGQEQFEGALREGELEKAVKILEGLPAASTPTERIDRLVAMYEGYRAIANAYAKIANQQSLGEKEELEEYRGLGNVDELQGKVDEIRDLKDFVRAMVN